METYNLSSLITGIVGLVAGLVALAVMALSILRPKPAIVNGYGKHLEEKIEKLTLQIDTQLRDIQASQQKISQLKGDLTNAQERIEFLENQIEAANVVPAIAKMPLLVVTGDDMMLEKDLAALRAIPTLRMSSIRPASMASISNMLNPRRASGRPVKYMHFAVHGTEQGLVMADGLADGAWLSAHLKGVNIAVLAGCKTAGLCDWMGVVPHVVSMSSDLDNSEASLFTKVFWSAIANGETFDQAIEECHDKCPSEVMDMVQVC